MKFSKSSDLCTYLRQHKCKTVYLSHEKYRERETREFAKSLTADGFTPLIAADFRRQGDEAVNRAIENADMSIVVAFDEETINTCLENGISVITLSE